MSTTYRPELDTSPELSPEVANWYQSAIGILRWAVELRRIDLTTEISMLATHMAMPREGHLIAVLRYYRTRESNTQTTTSARRNY
jgi:hypothetical protein